MCAAGASYEAMQLCKLQVMTTVSEGKYLRPVCKAHHKSKMLRIRQQAKVKCKCKAISHVTNSQRRNSMGAFEVPDAAIINCHCALAHHKAIFAY